MNYAKIGAVSFILWGLVHIVGGGAILLAVADSPTQGFAIYQEAVTVYTPLAGSVLGYLAYGFVWIAILVTYVGIRYNWHNSRNGLALNTFVVGLTDLGLLIFLVWPGFISWGEASPGLVLFAVAAIFGGMACNAAHSEFQAAS